MGPQLPLVTRIGSSPMLGLGREIEDKSAETVLGKYPNGHLVAWLLAR
jgi:hypothetical protein